MKFEIRVSKNGKYYWVLIARNGEVLCTSQILKRKQNARKSIRAAKKAMFAPVIDKTLTRG